MQPGRLVAKWIMVVLGLLVWPVRASAQPPAVIVLTPNQPAAVAPIDPPITSYELQIYAAGVDPVNGHPIQVTSFPAAEATCHLPPVPADPVQPVVNPTGMAWDNTPNGLGWCRAMRAAFFGGLPLGPNYRGTITMTNGVGTSPRSPASDPFSRSAAPAAAAVVRAIR